MSAMENCNCRLAVHVDDASLDRNGNVAWIDITWTHTAECAWCATRLIVFDATGVAQYSDMVETSPTRFDLIGHGVNITGGTVQATCEKCCGRTSAAQEFPPRRAADSPESPSTVVAGPPGSRQ